MALKPQAEYRKNVAVERSGNKLVLTIDLSKRIGQSKSGDNIIIATTCGNRRLEDIKGCEDIRLGLNLYTRAEDE